MEIWLSMVGWAFVLTLFCVILSVLANVYMAHSIAKFSVKMQEETFSKLKKLLGGKDCGKCGCESCEAYAIAMFYGQRGCEACPYTSEADHEKMRAIMQDFNDFLEGKDQEGRPERLGGRIKMWYQERKKLKQKDE